MSEFTIFVVEDNPQYAAFLEYHISQNPDYEVIKFATGKAVLDRIHEKPFAVTLDYSLPDMDGSQVLKNIKNEYIDIPVIMISGQEDISTAVDLLSEGAFDYIVKNDNAKDHIQYALKNLRENSLLRSKIKNLQKEVQDKYDFGNIIKGNSPAIKRIFTLMEKGAKTNINVSITGETGTGKELVAKSIHYNSARKDKSFVAVNVAAIPSDLMESELFGHEKGAFTGATSRRTGKFEEADGGTIFLDEIGEMPLEMQAKILRVLQEKEVVRIGSNEPKKINARIIVATHRSLLDEVKNGNFREDLYYRLLGLPIELPPLRERGNDILLLANFFIRSFCEDNALEPLGLSPDAKEKLMNYPFPGNIRELKAIVELASVMANENIIQPNDITLGSTDTLGELFQQELTLRDYNNKIVRYFLDKYNENVVLVAKKLNVGKSTIYRMLKNKEI